MTLKQALASITDDDRARMRRIADSGEPDLTDPDAPEITDDMLKTARRHGKLMFPNGIEAEQTIQFDSDVLAGLKKTGKDLSATINEVMRGYLQSIGVM